MNMLYLLGQYTAYPVYHYVIYLIRHVPPCIILFIAIVFKKKFATKNKLILESISSEKRTTENGSELEVNFKAIYFYVE